MKKLSVLFATLLVVALSVTSCKKAEQKVEPANPDTTTVVVDSANVDSTEYSN